MTWLTMSAKAACSSSRVGERSFTETAMVLESLAIFPAEEQTVHHTGQGVVEMLAVNRRG